MDISTKITQKTLDANLTRKKLTNAALPLFLKHGFDGTGINQILKNSALSKGAFYHHFNSKAQIYQEVISEFFLIPINSLNIDDISNLPLKIMRKVISDHYANIPLLISQNSDISQTRYYAAFYEALDRLPDFKDDVQNHYTNLIKTIAKQTNEEREIFPKVATAHARNIIGTLEGQLLLGILAPKQ